MELSAKAQNAGIAALEITVTHTETCVQNALRASTGDLVGVAPLNKRINIVMQAFNEANKWHSRAAGMLTFIDAITNDGPVFYSDEWDRIVALRQRSAASQAHLNDLFHYLNRMASQSL